MRFDNEDIVSTISAFCSIFVLIICIGLLIAIFIRVKMFN